MAKRFGRPAPLFDDGTGGQHMVRQIRMTREGSGLDGVYDSIAAIDAMHASVSEMARKRAIYDGVLHWVMMILFWGSVGYMLATFLRGLH